jgi:DNA-binding response OmpR family regulator
VLLDDPVSDKESASLATELRAMHADLPILIASAAFAEASRQRFAQDRRVALIDKPYNAAKLQAALDDLRARSRTGFVVQSADELP